MQNFSNQNKLFVTLIIVNVISFSSFSQNMNSPYSVYGIGDIDKHVYNRTTGMAGTGVAIKSSYYFVDNNPAAITGLPQSFLMAHVAFTGKASTYTGDPIDASNNKNKDLWIKRFALAIKLNKYWAGSIGFNQFSNVNYKFSGNRFIEGSAASYHAFYEGDGGLNDYHWTNAFAIGKHFSIGIKSSLIAGSINQVETLVDNDLQSTIVDSLQDYMANFRFQGGFIYESALNKNWDLSIGGTYSPKTKFSSERTLSVRGNGSSILQDKYLNGDRFYLPETIAAGIALKHNKKTTFAIDYTYENWSPLEIKGNGWQLINSSRVSGGVEFSKSKNQSGVKAEHNFFQLGAYYGNSYLQVRNTPITEYGFTAGIGGILSNRLMYAVSLEGGVKGTTSKGLIKETYFGLTFNISYREFLFSKGKVYD